MIERVSLLGPVSPGPDPSSSAVEAREYDISVDSGQTVMIPESDAMLISVILTMPEAIGDSQIILPGAKKGRRVALYFTHTATQFVFTAIDPGSTVSNGEVSVDKGNMIVFYCISESQRLWARCAPL